MADPITIADFKAYFARDFAYGSTNATVKDADITKAIGEANALFNPGLWTAGTDLEIAFEYLTAHCLVTAIRAAGGLKTTGTGMNSTGMFPINSKSAGPRSLSYAIPQDVKDNAILSQFMTTQYGQKYLEMLTPNLLGNVEIAQGETQP